MKRFLRALLRIHAAVDRTQAIQIAMQHASERGWPWVEPVHVSEGLTKIHVMTNAANRGGNANIWVAITTGEVIHSGFASR